MHRFSVEGMSCGHCVATVRRALEALDPDAQVDIDLALAQVAVVSKLSDERLIAAIEEAGYPARPAPAAA